MLRWRSYRLRSLVILVVGVCLTSAWVSHNYQVVQRRADLRAEFRNHDYGLRYIFVAEFDCFQQGDCPPYESYQRQLPWIRRMMGDEAVTNLIFEGDRNPTDLEKLRRVHRMFPETRIWVWPDNDFVPEGTQRLDIEQHYIMI